MKTVRMNKRHPKFDLKMELLVSLPVEPSRAWGADLCLDLGVTDDELCQIVASLRARGFHISNKMIPTGQMLEVKKPGKPGRKDKLFAQERRRSVAVRESDGGRHKVAGEEYWRAVYDIILH